MRCNISKQCREKDKLQWARLHFTYASHVSQCIFSLQRFSRFKPEIRMWIFFLLFFSEDNLGTLSVAAVKTRILSPSTTLAVLLKLVQSGWMLGCVCRPPAGSFLRDEAQGRRSTRSASLPWRSAAGKTPATWPARSGSTWRTRWSRGRACWWTLEERERRKKGHHFMTNQIIFRLSNVVLNLNNNNHDLDSKQKKCDF